MFVVGCSFFNKIFQINIAKINVKTENNFSKVVLAKMFPIVLNIKMKKKIHKTAFSIFLFTWNFK